MSVRLAGQRWSGTGGKAGCVREGEPVGRSRACGTPRATAASVAGRSSAPTARGERKGMCGTHRPLSRVSCTGSRDYRINAEPRLGELTLGIVIEYNSNRCGEERGRERATEARPCWSLWSLARLRTRAKAVKPQLWLCLRRKRTPPLPQQRALSCSISPAISLPPRDSHRPLRQLHHPSPAVINVPTSSCPPVPSCALGGRWAARLSRFGQGRSQ